MKLKSLLFGIYQPPSGGCVLKQLPDKEHTWADCQPPSGGCVLKPALLPAYGNPVAQPPSGGCVLKPVQSFAENAKVGPAAFRRLCVETVGVYYQSDNL